MKLCIVLLVLVISVAVATAHKRGRKFHHHHHPHIHHQQQYIIKVKNYEDNQDARRRDTLNNNDSWENDNENNADIENIDDTYDEENNENDNNYEGDNNNIPYNYKQQKDDNENARRRDNLGFLGAFSKLDLHNFIRHKIEENLEKNVDGGEKRNNFFNLKQKVSTNKKQQHHSKKSKHVKKHPKKKVVEETFDDPEMYADEIDPQEDEREYQKAPVKKLLHGSSKMHRPLQPNMIMNAPYVDQQQQQQLYQNNQQVQENVPGSQIKVKLAVGATSPDTPVPIATVNNEDGSGSGSGTAETSAESGQQPEVQNLQQQQPPQLFLNKQIPQESVNQIQASTVHSNSATYPNFPVPPMIPIPLLFNSGESEGSASGMMTDVKSAKDMNAGESGYGESIQNTYTSGDWVQRAINKQKSNSKNDDDDDDEDDGEEGERWMKHKGKENNKLQHPSAMNSPLQKNANYRQQQQKLKVQGQGQQQTQEQQQQTQQTQAYVAEHGYPPYVNQNPQQQYAGYYQQQQQQQQQQQAYGSQNRYNQEQYYAQNQAYNRPKQAENVPLRKPQEPVASAAAVSAASASFQEKVVKAWETQEAPAIATAQQGPYTLSESPAIVEQPNNQPSTFSWDNFGQSQGMIAECADTCPASCAPSCDAECCNRGKIEESKNEQENKKIEAPMKPAATSSMPEFENLIAASNQQPQNAGVFNDKGEIVTQIAAPNEQQVNAFQPAATLQLPDVTIGPNGAAPMPQAPVVPVNNLMDTASFYPQAEANQAFQQPAYVAGNTQDMNAMNNGRFNVDNQQFMPEQAFNNQQINQQTQSTTDLSRFLPQTVENTPQPIVKKIANLRQFGAPPPVATHSNPLPTDIESQQQAPAASATETKNFALKPITPILLRVPSVVHAKKEGSDVRYPSPQCMKACETKCLPFCPNNCCGIPTERKRKRNQIYLHYKHY